VGQTPEANIESDPQMKEMLINKQNHTIRAASDGTIWRINFQAGEVIRAGDSIAEIIKDVDPIIETFVPETIAFQVVLGQEFRVSTLSAPATYYRATITAITPQIVGEIDTANSMINRIVRGRRLLLTPAEKTPMMPGESVMIEKVPKYWFF
jgi:multidrug resistance efflux pump